MSSTPTSNDAPARPVATILLCCLLQAVGGGLGWSLLPPLMRQIQADLGVSHAMAGFTWGAASLGIVLASSLGGVAVDRFGPRRVAGIAMLAGAVACAARSFAIGPWTLALAMGVFGVHIAFVAPSIPKALAAHVPLAKLGRANGLSVLAYTLGTAITLTAGPLYLAPAVGGWRNAMLVAAVAMAVAAIVWLACARDRGSLARHAKLSDGIRMMSNPQLVRVAGMHFLLVGGTLALLGLLPLALYKRGLHPLEISLAVSGWLVAASIANFVGPMISDSIGRRRPFLIGGAVVAALGLAGVAALPQSATLPCLAIAALGGGSFAPLLYSIPLEMPAVGPQRAGAALGVLVLVGQAGGFLLSTISGQAMERAGFAVAIAFLAVAHLAIAGAAKGLLETATPRSPASSPPSAPVVDVAMQQA